MKRFTRRPGLLPYQSFLPPRLLKTRDSGPPACRPKTRRWIYSENTPPTITCWWAGPIWSAGVITADLELTPGEPSLETPERFWIPELAWRFRFFWQQQNWCGRSLYQKARKQGWLQHQ